MSPNGELLATKLTAQVLDGFVFAVRAKPNQGVDDWVIVQVVIAAWVGAEVACCANRLFLAARLLAHTPGDCVLVANSLRVLSACHPCLAARAIFVGLGLENTGFGNGWQGWLLVWLFPGGQNVAENEGEGENQSSQKPNDLGFFHLKMRLYWMSSGRYLTMNLRVITHRLWLYRKDNLANIAKLSRQERSRGITSL
jgi:hypothetical protein